MQEDLSGKTVLITGASRGLGAALALAFGRAGAAVALCARSAEPLARVAEEVRRLGARCTAHALDITREVEVGNWVREAEGELGASVVLINNASVLGPRVPIAEYPPAEWRRVLEVGLTGAFLAARAALPSMMRAGAGSIINVSSGAAVPPRTSWGAYAIAKHALDGFTLNLAEELKGTGIRVNSVDPGAMRTEMRAAAYPDEDPQTVKPPAAATAVFLWLASDAARAVTGQRFRADDFAQP